MSAYSEFYDEVFELFHSKKIDIYDGEKIIRDKWIEEKKYEKLIAYILQNWGSGNCIEFMTPLVDALIMDEKISLYKRIWRAVLKIRGERFWDFYIGSLKEKHPDITWVDMEQTDTSNYIHLQEIENDLHYAAFNAHYYYKGLLQYKEGLEKMNDIEELKKVNGDIQHLRSLDKPKIVKKKARDKRKMNESIFWELIEESRNETENKSDFIEVIGNKLSAFKATEIKRFQKFLLTFYNQLNHWDNWALAFIVRRGCGDDGFDYFRLWVLSKGKFAFETINSFNISNFEKVFDLEDPQLEEFIYVAEDIYEKNTGEPMKEPSVKTQKIKGKPFEEDNICSQYSELCSLFRYPQSA